MSGLQIAFSVLWILSAILVITLSAIALFRIRFRMALSGLLVIAFYNLLFLVELIVSIYILVCLSLETPVDPSALLVTAVIKNLDMVFKAYFTFEMYRVRLYLECNTPAELASRGGKMRKMAIVVMVLLVANQGTGFVMNLQSPSLVEKTVCTGIFLGVLTPMLYIFSSQILFFVHRKEAELKKKKQRVTCRQHAVITWLNVWIILMIIRLLLSFALFVYLCLHVAGSSVVNNKSFAQSE